MALEPGAQLGRYKVLRLLGAGAMGEVYLAEDPQIGRQLALKTVRIVAGSGHDKDELQERLVREARAAGRLIHPNIVTLFDAGESDGVFYLAFEFVDGVDLSERLRGAPPLTVKEALRIARQVAEGLDAAHRVGIVHRDIKPANILLDPDGQVKISDFGIAKMVGQTELTQTGSVVGSPHYLSPEQVRGEPLDGRSDLFSLGVVLYEMLTRLRPFEGETITTLVYQILSTQPAPLGEARPQLPPNLTRVVTRLLHKDAVHRFASGREFADALAQCERELPAALLESPAAGTVSEIAARRAAAATGSSGVRSPARPPALPPTEVPGGPPPPPPPPPSVPSGGSASSSAVDMDTAATALLSRKDTAQVAAVPPAPPIANVSPVAASSSALPVSGSQGKGTKMVVLAGVLFLLVGLGVGGFFAWKSFQRPERPEVLVAETEPVESAESDLPTRREEESSDEAPAGWREVPVPGESSETATSDLAEASQRDSVDRQDRAESGPIVEDSEQSRDASGVADRVEELGAPPQREPLNRDTGSSSTQSSEPKPPADRDVTRPREEASDQESSGEDSRPSEVDLRAEPEPEPEIEVLPVEKTLSSSLSLRFDVTPDDTFVLIKEVTERRFISIGKAEEWSGKKDARVYDLPGPGEYYVRFRSQGRREVTYRVVASHGAGATPIVLRMQ